jgi:hypothetical protein
MLRHLVTQLSFVVFACRPAFHSLSRVAIEKGCDEQDIGKKKKKKNTNEMVQELKRLFENPRFRLEDCHDTWLQCKRVSMEMYFWKRGLA